MDLHEVGWRVWTGLTWLKKGTGSGFLWIRWWTFGFNKMRGIYGLAEELLASQEEVCRMGSPQLNTMPWSLRGDRTHNFMHAWPIVLEPVFNFYVVPVVCHAEAKGTYLVGGGAAHVQFECPYRHSNPRKWPLVRVA
jgi:hypothetical protein